VSRVPVTGDEIRRAFLRFFEGKGHTVLPSSPLIPQGDPTMLLTTAGMVQIKPYFLGLATPPSPRLASCQKCFRTTDIESVGDTKHLTFFEMLGNFSVGDYFKKEAIDWAWDFVTQWLKLPPERLWITIFLDDEEAFKCWQEVGVSTERITRLGEEDNFWGPAGDSGPCGPCSEILYDFGEKFGCDKPDCGPGCDCGRFSEIWNLVFTQYNQDKEGRRTPLPKPNIDTGMGLERTAAVMQGKISVYETDLFAPVVARVCGLAGKQYGQVDKTLRDEAADRAISIVAEHARGITFLIADGVVPDNEGRGYVLRRILRRASLFGRKLGIKRFLEDVATEVIQNMQPVYPELGQNYVHICRVIDEEEKSFHETLDFSLNLFDGLLEERKNETEKTISGQIAFPFYDTYGLPREILAEVAEQGGFTVDWEGFEKEMEQQRERARAARKSKLGEIAEAPSYTQGRGNLPEIEFVGYDSQELKHRSDVLLLTLKGTWKTRLFEGDEGEVVLRETPFYGEMGGQVGDMGEILGQAGRFIVEDTIRPWPELIIHRGKVVEGYISLSDAVEAKVDEKRRLDIARNHTATHLLQAALRAVLGERVRQSGSLVAPERLRFDFTHLGSINKEQLAKIQHLVNEKIRENLTVKIIEDMAYTEAVSMGAIALFEEKYGETVRVLKIGDPPFSMEVCGGTHVKSTGEIGFFHITTEASIGSGMRRIEAVTGRGAEKLLEQRLSTLEALAQELETSPEKAQSKLSATLAELDKERKRAISLERKLASREAEDLQVRTTKGIKFVSQKVSVTSSEAMREIGDRLRGKLVSGVVVLGAIYNDRPNFMAMVTPDLVAKGFHAGEIVKQIATATGGGGGGTAELGQGSGKYSTKLDKALKETGRCIQMHYDKDSGTWRTKVD